MTTQAHGQRSWSRNAARLSHACLRTASLVVTAMCYLALGFELVVRVQPMSPEQLDGFSESIRFTDTRGAFLRDVVDRKTGARAQWTPLSEISPFLIQATIAVEDARFYDHDGIDVIGVVRAIRDNARARRVVSGASTLTMQLARLIEPSDKTLWGKLSEMVRARRLERALSKREILEQYLNRAPYGGGIIGVEAASQRYFGKRNHNLGLAEAALIAGLPKAPSQLDPRRNPEGARYRQHKVLERMWKTHAITRAEYDRALAERLVYTRETPRLAAMHFTDYALGQLERSSPDRRGMVRTTLDRGLQADIEGAVASHVAALRTSNLSNAAVVVLSNDACEVRAMVGSIDYFDDDRSGAVNGALAPRQPGSTLKPFTYALAMEQAGMTPASVIADIPTEYGDATGALFRPQNFSHKFSGPVLLGDALGRSLNVPAIRVANEVGPEALLARLHEFGFASLHRTAAHYGLGLTLGNGEVTLVELAQAYATLARGGLTCQARALESDGPDGAAGEDRAPARVLSERISFLITHILSDESLRIAAFGPANALLFGFPVAVKTGTSSNWRDSWAVGYTDRYTVAVWAGNFDGSSMNHLAGATGAGPLFHTVMSLVVDRAHRRGEQRPRSPVAPEGVVEVEVCSLSGHRPSEHCPHRRRVYVLAENQPDEVCDWHEPVSVDVRNQLRAGPLCPDEFVAQRVYESLPPEYAEWQADSDLDAPPPGYSPLCPLSGAIPGSVVITYPRDGEVFLIEPGFARDTQTLRLAARADGRVAGVTFSVDGERVATAEWPYIARWRLEPGQHTLAVAAPGQRGHQVAFEVR